ncbi:MAG: alpha-D-ribose 1-methylphosphonate 5-triphosphate diphosphatase [Pseudomonadales bacterium]|nr:alpha-D-ribose 1-methylphosphonate 5-triphosphate diphosphatase [Pseudomonadales bacterium]
MDVKQILTNAQVVTKDEVFLGTVVVEHGAIVAIDQGLSQVPGGIDCQGDFLIPGLVELHTDNLEKYFTPRPGVDWPSRSAVLTHDAQIVASGITTVFDALSLGDINQGRERLRNLQDMVDALNEAEQQSVHRANHYLHLRCEVSYADVLGLFESLLDHPMVHLVSVMDHSPGQRQFVKEEKYREYYQGKFGMTTEELDNFIARQKAASALYSDQYRAQIVARCKERAIPVASHDDATVEHVQESANYGMRIAEFPTTMAAARHSHENGLSVLMGAPNIVRGGSHSGNIAASELAREGVLDILSSDYYPSSLLEGAFRLRHEENAYDLPKAIQTVTSTPAECAGLADRGEIAIGKRADLVWVREHQNHPLIQHVWNGGKRVF